MSACLPCDLESADEAAVVFRVIARDAELAPGHRGTGILTLVAEHRDLAGSLAVAARVRAAPPDPALT